MSIEERVEQDRCHGCGKLWSEVSPDCVFNYHADPTEPAPDRSPEQFVSCPENLKAEAVEAPPEVKENRPTHMCERGRVFYRPGHESESFLYPCCGETGNPCEVYPIRVWLNPDPDAGYDEGYEAGYEAGIEKVKAALDTEINKTHQGEKAPADVESYIEGANAVLGYVRAALAALKEGKQA